MRSRTSGMSDVDAGRRRWVMLLYALTLFSNAALLFSVQPLVAKSLLPRLGGSASVWTTCMLFFQFMLLAGYTYADQSFRCVPPRRRVLVHGMLLGLAILVLPLQMEAVPVTATSPVTRLLWTLTLSVGLPFFLLAATAPMLQRWFSRTGHPGATDPYFLYAVSNVGSLAALLSYPAVVEPLVTLSTQVRWWNTAFAGAALLTIACEIFGVAEHRRSASEQPPTGASAASGTPSAARKLQWVILSFVPSSLMLAVTRYLSTDVAPVPLLWVVPLAIYLLTYVVAFGARTRRVSAFADHATPLAATALAVLIIARLGSPLWFVIPIHLLAFAVIALACHGRLAAARPGVEHLTGFYFWLAVGGVSGGLFNSIVAPAAFVTIAEYPITVALACATFVRRTDLDSIRRGLHSLAAPVAAGLLVLLARPAIPWAGLPPGFLLIYLAAPALVCYTVARRPALFALGVALMLGAGSVHMDVHRTIAESRTFYGSYRVEVDRSGRYHDLYSGSTVHGRQLVDGGALEPLAYYHREGPIGDVFRARRPAGSLRVAVVGLGVGALAAYATPDDNWTFFEIDPEVERIARDPTLFTYLARAAVRCSVVIGDGRISMNLDAQDRYDLIVIDAFTSDAIPVHLLTREALSLYLSRLRPGGVVAFHISNRHLDLARVLTTLAHDAGAAAMMRQDNATAAQRERRRPSDWFATARHAADLSAIGQQHAGWRVPQVARLRSVWTDDFSNLLATLTWR